MSSVVDTSPKFLTMHASRRSWEPSLIANKCASLAAAATNLSTKVSLFASEVRSSKRGMNAVVRELASLNMCLDALEYDQRRRVPLPEDMRNDLGDILNVCESLVNQIGTHLLKIQTRSIGVQVRWEAPDQLEIKTLRTSLETNCAFLDIALSTGISTVLVTRLTRALEQQSSTTNTGHNGVTSSSVDTDIDLLFNELATQIADLWTQLNGMKCSMTESDGVHVFVDHSQEYIESLLASLKDHMRNTLRNSSAQSNEAQSQLEVKLLLLELNDLPAPNQGHTGEPSEQSPMRENALVQGPATSPDFNYLIAHEQVEDKFRAEHSRRVGLEQEVEGLQANLLKERGQVECLEEEIQRLQSVNEDLATRVAGEKTGDINLLSAHRASPDDAGSEKSFKTQATMGLEYMTPYGESLDFATPAAGAPTSSQQSALAALMGASHLLAPPLIKFRIRIDWVESPACIVSVQAQSFFLISLLHRNSSGPVVLRNQLIDALCRIIRHEQDFIEAKDHGITSCRTIKDLRIHLCSISEALLSALSYSERGTVLQLQTAPLSDDQSIQVLATHGQDKSIDVWLSLLPVKECVELESKWIPIAYQTRPYTWTDPEKWLSSISFDVIKLHIASENDRFRASPTNKRSKARWTQFALKRASKEIGLGDYGPDQLPQELQSLASSFTGRLSPNTDTKMHAKLPAGYEWMYQGSRKVGVKTPEGYSLT